MRIALAALFALLFIAAPTRADIAPPYPEFHAGIEIAEGQPYPKIASVVKNSPAARAGVQVGDQVLALNGAYSKTAAPFYFWLKGLRGRKNSKAELIVLRQESEVRVFTLARTISVR